MKKDIVFLCQYFYPENNSSAMLPFDTAKHLAENGMSVGAVCGYPREYSDEKSAPKNEEVSGVEIHRLNYLHIKRAKKIGRLINYLSFTVSALFNVCKLKNYRSVIVYSNPPVLPLVALLANLLFGTKIIFVSYDVYPEIAVAMNSLKDNSLIVRGMNRINRKLFKKASLVVALTDEMKEYLLERRPQLSEQRIITIPNWAHEEGADTCDCDYLQTKANETCFTVTYLGNMGICQDMNTLLAAAEELQNCSDVRFVLAGHGSKKQSIEKLVAEKQLNNVLVADFLKGCQLEQTVACSSCFVVTLEDGIAGMCAPSKYYSYLLGGKPVISITGHGSYLAQEIECERIGAAISIGDSAGAAKAIMKMAESREEASLMGARARKLYYSKYSKTISLEKYSNAICDVIGNREKAIN